MLTSITHGYCSKLSSRNGKDESQANRLFCSIYLLYWNVVEFHKFRLNFRSGILFLNGLSYVRLKQNAHNSIKHMSDISDT